MGGLSFQDPASGEVEPLNIVGVTCIEGFMSIATWIRNGVLGAGLLLTGCVHGYDGAGYRVTYRRPVYAPVYVARPSVPAYGAHIRVITPGSRNHARWGDRAHHSHRAGPARGRR